MAFICNRLQVVPRWILTFSGGILIGWITFSLNARLYSDTSHYSDNKLVIPRTPALVQTFPSPVHTTSSNATYASGSHHQVAQLPPKYYPTSKFDLQSWQYFDKTAVYRDDYVNMAHWRHANRHIDSEIETVLAYATKLVGQELKRRLKMTDLTSGYMRHNPTRGYEYIIDARYRDTCKHCVGKPFSRRVSFVRPLSDPVVVPDLPVSKQVVNVVVPISNVNQRFSEFMENFEHAFLNGGDAVHLLFVVYQDDISGLENILKLYRSRHKRAKMSLVQGKGMFSRGRALHYGISSLKENDLIFICDVDITIEHSFMDRCRKNTVQGERVFYPVVFKQYNAKYTHTQNLKPGKASINRKNGHWFYYSYGMLCIYKSDYTAVGGLDIEIEGWGLEDVLLYEAILKAKLEVLKVPDPALTHRWHESRCPSTLTNKQHSDCLGSLYEGVADKKELAQYIYEHGYEIHEE